MPGFIGGNTLLRELTDEAIERLVSFREANQASVLFLRSLGGAYGDVPQDATAFPARDATWFAMAGAFDIPGLVTDESRATASRRSGTPSARWARPSTATSRRRPIRRWSRACTRPRRWRAWPRLKREWDPQNLFCRCHNVQPA